jgi:hypothetical protein
MNLVVEGTMDQLNAALDGLQYQAVFDGPSSVSLNIAVDDQGHGVGGDLTGNAAVGISVAGINDPPVAVADTYTLTSHESKLNSLSPISYWRLDETSGSSAVDEVGTQNGAYINGPNRGVAGIVPLGNKAVNLEPNDHVRVDHDDAYLIDQGAIQLWFKADTNNATQDAGLLSLSSREIPRSLRAPRLFRSPFCKLMTQWRSFQFQHRRRSKEVMLSSRQLTSTPLNCRMSTVPV